MIIGTFPTNIPTVFITTQCCGSHGRGGIRFTQFIQTLHFESVSIPLDKRIELNPDDHNFSRDLSLSYDGVLG
jgi:hypothetical protein